MWNTSRALRETVIRALAKVCLVWAVAVLGTLFVTMTAQAQRADAYTPSFSHRHAESSAFSVASSEAPRTAGLALALLVLGGGATVLAVGASRGNRAERAELKYAADPDPVADLPLALGLGILA